MTRLSVDYTGLVRGLQMPLASAELGSALLDAVAKRYEHQFPDCSLLQAPEYRTLAAWAITPVTVGKRDVSYQRGFPLPPDPDRSLVDRGHLIPHLSGGEFGPNIFRQRRDLNRGWSSQGKRFRALEREAATTPGTFYFGRLMYEDGTAYPTEIETGLLRGETLHVDRFRNRLTR
jgi:hypothetical protein